jgi:hypothetical protein
MIGSFAREIISAVVNLRGAREIGLSKLLPDVSKLSAHLPRSFQWTSYSPWSFGVSDPRRHRLLVRGEERFQSDRLDCDTPL